MAVARKTRNRGDFALAGVGLGGIGEEFNDLDFDQILGAPLMAVIKAQIKAAVGTVDFVYKYGFKSGSGGGGMTSTQKAAMFTMKYDRPNADGSVDRGEFSIPFILLVPIPVMRITEFNMHFKAEITRVQVSNESFSFGAGVRGKVGIGYEGLMFGVFVNASYARQQEEGRSETKTYTYDVKLRAGMEQQMPEGYEKLYSTLESAISEQAEGMDAPEEEDSAK